MSEKTEKAKEYFLNKSNCSQSTLVVFADDLGLSTKQALSLSAGFGAGMCYQAKTCGAVTGAYMALGLISGQKFTEPEMVKENAYQLISQFNKAFIKTFDSTECKALIGLDIGTSEGMEKGKEMGVFTNKCPLFVQFAVELVEKELLNHKRASELR